MPLFFFLCLTLILQANPFKIEGSYEKELTENEYVQIQEKLRQIDITPTLEALYPKPNLLHRLLLQKKPLQKKEDFQGRMSRGIKQTLICLEKKQIPSQELFKINDGGEYCLVSFASYDGIYPDLLKNIPKKLEETGFNGYFLSLTGGFPNPTGKEILFSGVPYSFKIFALLEAKKRGFHKVLWIDSALLPLKDPTPLFNVIEKTGCFFQERKNSSKYLLPSTHEVLLQETGIDLHCTTGIRARIMGLNLGTKKAETFIEDYYHLVELGTPFMSCFPEEFVISALLAKNPELWPFQPFEKVVMNERKLHGKKKEHLKEEGFFFLLQHH